jgi:hypothetical protein
MLDKCESGWFSSESCLECQYRTSEIGICSTWSERKSKPNFAKILFSFKPNKLIQTFRIKEWYKLQTLNIKKKKCIYVYIRAHTHTYIYTQITCIFHAYRKYSLLIKDTQSYVWNLLSDRSLLSVNNFSVTTTSMYLLKFLGLFLFPTFNSVLTWVNLWKFASSEALLQWDSQSLCQDGIHWNMSPKITDTTNLFLAPLPLKRLCQSSSSSPQI